MAVRLRPCILLLLLLWPLLPLRCCRTLRPPLLLLMSHELGQDIQVAGQIKLWIIRIAVANFVISLIRRITRASTATTLEAGSRQRRAELLA